jgi:hypothetical protein
MVSIFLLLLAVLASQLTTQLFFLAQEFATSTEQLFFRDLLLLFLAI